MRTAGVGKSAEALQWDLSFRLKHWEAIKKAAESCPAPFLIHQESNVLFAHSAITYVRTSAKSLSITRKCSNWHVSISLH